MNSAPKCVKPGCQRPKRVSPEERRRRPETGRAGRCAGALRPARVQQALDNPDEYHLGIPLEGLVLETARETPRWGGSAAHRKCRNGLLIRGFAAEDGEFHPQARPGPFRAVHAPLRAFFWRSLPEESILRRRRRRLPVRVAPGLVPQGLRDQFQTPRPSGLPVLPLWTLNQDIVSRSRVMDRRWIRPTFRACLCRTACP